MNAIHPWVLGLGQKPEPISDAGCDFDKVYPAHRYCLEIHAGPIGYSEGEKCNRLGCLGIIRAYGSDSCSCHINPPCSSCTTAREYCPECDWDAEEEDREYWKAKDEAEKKWFETPAGQEYRRKLKEDQERRAEIEKTFELKFLGRIPVDKFDCRREGHTHSSMRIRFIFPPSGFTKEMMKEIEGTFGGRFEQSPSHWRGVYIAYTD